MTVLTATQYDILRATWSPVGGAYGASAVITAPDATTIKVLASSASAVPNLWTIWFSVPQTGTYSIAWSSTTGGTQTDTVTVAAYVVPQLMTIQDCYESLNIPATQIGVDTARDADMLKYAQAGLGVVEGVIGPVVAQTKSQIFDGGQGSVKLQWAPTTILAVIENGQLIADWVADIPAGILRAGTTWWNRPFWPGIQNIEIQYIAGAGVVQPHVVLAIRDEFRLLWQQGRQGRDQAMNTQILQTSAVPVGYAIPYRVLELLQRVDQMPGFA